LDWTTILLGSAAGLATGLATLLGGAFILFRSPSRPAQQDVMLGFAAGVMLSASYLSLIIPAVEFARSSNFSSFGSAALVAVALLLGAASLEWLRRSASRGSQRLLQPQSTSSRWAKCAGRTSTRKEQNSASARISIAARRATSCLSRLPPQHSILNPHCTEAGATWAGSQAACRAPFPRPAEAPGFQAKPSPAAVN
jgi:zinc transporter ZupT